MNMPDFKETGDMPFDNVRKANESMQGDPYRGTGWSNSRYTKKDISFKDKKKKRKVVKQSRRRNRR